MIASTTVGSESYFNISIDADLRGVGTYSGSITKLVLLARKNLSQNSAHNLTTSSLGQVRNDEDGLWSRERTNALSDLKNKLFLELVIDLVSVLDGYECINSLPGQFIIDTDDCGFCDGVVLDQGCFYFGG